MANNRKLYRFGRLSKYTFDSIQNNYIWFSSPLQFNDPFDCQIFADYFPFEIEDFNILQPYYDNYYQDVILKSFTANGVACFSESKDEILMWSHYADYHRGICLEFEFPDMPENLFSLCKQVRYCVDYPKLDFSDFLEPGQDNTVNFINRMILTKSKSWEYEKEWRMVLPGYGDKKVNFPPHLLKAVYLGCNISKRNKNKLLKILNDRSVLPELYQCKKSTNAFSLEYLPLDLSQAELKQSSPMPTSFVKAKQMGWDTLSDREKDLERIIGQIAERNFDSIKHCFDMSDKTIDSVMLEIGALPFERNFVIERMNLNINIREAIKRADQVVETCECLLDVFNKEDEKWEQKRKEFAVNGEERDKVV